MADITMSLNDTLELDTIIKESEDAIIPITVEQGGSHNLNGIQTHTGIFDPVDSGDYILDINGQKLTIEVTDPNNMPDEIVDDFNDNISGWDNGSYNTNIVKEGNGSLNLYSGGKGNSSTSNEGDGLNYYPKSGDEVTFWLYMTNTANGVLELVKNNSNYIGAGMSPGQTEEFYIVQSNVDDGEVLSSIDTGVSSSNWYQFYLKTGDPIKLEVYDIQQNLIGSSISADKKTDYNYGRDINLSINAGNKGDVYLDIIKSTI